MYNGYIKRLKLSKYDTYLITHTIRDPKTKELTYRMRGIDKCGQEISFEIKEEEVNYNFTYPYCYTVHSLQGRDTDENVTIFNIRDLRNSYESKKWFWTAITRCKSLHNISYYLGDPVEDTSLDMKDSTIERRIAQYKEQDNNKDRYEKVNYITVNYVRNMIKVVNFKCPEEDCDVEFTNTGSSTWSVDRIDNNLGHNKGNVKIMCLRCNKSKH